MAANKERVYEATTAQTKNFARTPTFSFSRDVEDIIRGNSIKGNVFSM
jgi:UDP-3-O-acyl-N-acetylglucosamine deacetylase